MVDSAGFIYNHDRRLIIKSVISASVAKETTEATRARGYSIFYMMVNIGAFTGKTVIDPLRNMIGDQAYIYINYFSGFMTLIALLAVFFCINQLTP